MTEEMELVKQIKLLNTDRIALQSDREKIFLSNLKNKLGIYMAQNPVRMGKFENFYYNIKESDPFISLKNIGLFNNSFTGSAALALIILAIGVGGIASASQASLPGDNLYPIKILSEELRSAFTVSPSAKALLEVEFSAKRIEEIKKVVQKSGIESKNINVALDRLQKNTAKAADIIDREKQNGNDVSELARSIEEKNTANQNTLDQILKKTVKEMGEPDETSDREKNETNDIDAEIPTKKKTENNVIKNSIKKEKPDPIPNSQDKKIETKKDKNDATTSPEIKIKTYIEKNDDDFDREDDGDKD